MKKGQIVEGIVEHVDFPNKGVVLIEETNEAGERETHRVEVKGVIPGQKVRVSIKKARKGKAKGILREVTERSAIETANRSVRILEHVVVAVIRQFHMTNSLN